MLSHLSYIAFASMAAVLWLSKADASPPVAKINGSQIQNGVITDDHISPNAAIKLSKLDGSIATKFDVSVVAMPSGCIVPFAGATPPAGFVLCDGAAYDGTSGIYASLWKAIGTTWGGTGQNSFFVPDFRGRSVLGAGQGTNLSNRNLGDYGGEESHVLTVDEMPTHDHVMSNNGNPLTTGNVWSGVAQTAYSGIAQTSYGSVTGYQHTGLSGNGKGHNNMPPWAAVNYIIKL
jgi:microcystin-dependent protein